MNPRRLIASWLVLLCACPAIASPTTLPSGGPIPEGLGVNIHFTDPKPGEVKMIADAGITWVRMDFSWDGTERQRGVYDFSAYDRLLTALDEYHIRPLFILAYANPLYDDNLAPHTDEARAAMAKWAAAAVTHFKGRGAVWEMWNEPNIGFWKPKPNVEEYIKLTKAVGGAIDAVAPDEPFVGPGCSGVDFDFLDACFKGGLLEQWDAVTVHPYRQSEPESAAADYAKLRDLIERAQAKPADPSRLSPTAQDPLAPARPAARARAVGRKTIPIISGEWGYSAAWDGVDEQKQGRYLPRQWLVNIAAGVPVSIWYDWTDDGPDVHEPEHHFGITRHRSLAPKPAYRAAKTLTEQLRGFEFSKRLVVADEDVHVLLFKSGQSNRLAVWTTGDPREVTVPASRGRFERVNYLGEHLPAVDADVQGLTLRLDEGVQYLSPVNGNEWLALAASWERLPEAIRGRRDSAATVEAILANPFPRELEVRLPDGLRKLGPNQIAHVRTQDMIRNRESGTPVDLPLEVVGVGRIVQRTRLVPTNPMAVSIVTPAYIDWGVRIDNPARAAFVGELGINGDAGTAFAVSFFEEQPTDHYVWTFRGPNRGRTGRLGATVTELAPGAVPIVCPPCRYVPFGPFLTTPAPATTPAATAPAVRECVLAVDGDPAVAASASLAYAEGPYLGAEAQQYGAGSAAIEVACDFADGWRFATVRPTGANDALPGAPSELRMWLWTDGSGLRPRLRFVDAAGETFQPDAIGMMQAGWNYVRFKLDGSDLPGHWGGDGRIDYPIRIESLLVLDNVARRAIKASTRFAKPFVLYGD